MKNTTWLCTLLLFAACDKSNSLGEVDETDTGAQATSTSGGTDSDASESATSTGSASATSTASATATTGPTTGEPGGSTGQLECPPNTIGAQPAGCLAGPAPLFQGDEPCYELCAEPGADCGDGYTCQRVTINPCPCEDDIADCCDACGAEEMLCMPASYDVACAWLLERTFLSVEEYECGQTPEGVEMCQWQVSFSSDGTFEWLYSDVGEGGGYECADGQITTDGGTSGSVDVESATLLWDGIEYHHEL